MFPTGTSHNFYHSSWRSWGVVFYSILWGLHGEWHFHSWPLLIRELQKIPIFLHLKKDISEGNHVLHDLARGTSFLEQGGYFYENLSNLRKETYLELAPRMYEGRIRLNLRCLEIFRGFASKAKERNIRVKLIWTKESLRIRKATIAFFGIESPSPIHIKIRSETEFTFFIK